MTEADPKTSPVRLGLNLMICAAIMTAGACLLLGFLQVTR